MKQILVMGGAGYIGSHTLKHLRERGFDAFAADNLATGHKEAVLDAEFVEADLQDKSSLDKMFDTHEVEAVVHFAAFSLVGESVTDPAKYYRNNVVGTLNLLDSMRAHGVHKIVFSSTCATYGNPVAVPMDEHHPQQPINPYGQTKFVIEKIFEDYRKAYGLKYIALRYFNAAGADESGLIGESHSPESHLIPLVLQAVSGKRENIKVFGTDYDTPDGTCLRDYIHVADLAEAHRLALEKLDEFQGCINLGTGIPTSVMEIIRVAEKVCGKKCPMLVSERRAGDPAKLYADNRFARQILGWIPKYLKIEDIIRTAWNWEQHRRF